MSSIAWKLITGLLTTLSGSPDEPASKSTLDVYKSGTEFRWRLIDADGTVLATSGQTFNTQAATIAEIKELQRRAKQQYQTEETATRVQVGGEKSNYWWEWVKENRADQSQDFVLARSEPNYKSLANAETAHAQFAKEFKSAKIVTRTK